jgi:hypothetical protein
MDLDERRLLLACTFDRTVETVLDGFLHEGFTIAPIEAGDLHDCSHPGHSMRFALLDATLPELSGQTGPAAGGTPLPSCRVSVFELDGSCTLVTAENRLIRYPLLASLASRAADRIGDALRLIVRDELATAR